MKINQVRIRAIGKLIAELKHGQYADTDHAAAMCRELGISLMKRMIWDPEQGGPEPAECACGEWDIPKRETEKRQDGLQ